MPAYYNEFEPYPAAWLRNLIAAGLLPAGDVDERDIKDVTGDDLRGYTQCHFFAGIGGWPYALRLAGWADDSPVWTGSCPCQPFSAAGKGLGEADARHLWPEFRRLISECNPPVVFGEQVASRAGRTWLSRVRADLEEMGYGVGAADLCAASAGAPHIRQRLWWVADAQQRTPERHRHEMARQAGQNQGGEEERERVWTDTRDGSELDGMAHPHRQRPVRLDSLLLGQKPGRNQQNRPETPWSSPTHPIRCYDGKTRRTQPGIHPLAHGIPARVGQIKAYGNAIVPQVAKTFIQAYLETLNLAPA